MDDKLIAQGQKDYFLTTSGEVYSVSKRRQIKKTLKPISNGAGYYRVPIKGKLFYIHQLVLEHFVGPQTSGL